MQLNNTITNEVIKVEKIDPWQNILAFGVYSVHGIKVDAGILKPIPIMKTKYSEATTFDEYALDKLVAFIPDTVKEVTDNDWFHSTRVKRLIVPNDLILSSQKVGNDLSVVIDRLKGEDIAATEKFIFLGSKYTVV